MSLRVLAIEDDPEMVSLLRVTLEELGVELDHAPDGVSGLEKAVSGASQGPYSLVMIDMNLPRLGGLEVCRQLREKNARVPIMLVTSRTEEIDKVLGLEHGADDYVTKPFSTRELVARVRALLRRAAAMGGNGPQEELNQSLVFGPLVVDVTRRRVSVNERDVALTAIEFELLTFLASHPGRTFTREELMTEVWGYQSSRFEATITTHFSRLRKKIEPDPLQPRFLKTVHGVGYRFADPAEVDAPG